MSQRTLHTISVLGCGWLGLPLAEYLMGKGYQVKGSTTNRSKLSLLENNGITATWLDLQRDQPAFDTSFFNTDVLILNFPPKRVPDIEQLYPLQVARAMVYASQQRVTHVVFVSSTSIYPEVNGWVNEDEALLPEKTSGRALLKAEAVVQSYKEIPSTILRMGGLIGADRNPVHSLLRKKQAVNGRTPVNLLHQRDAIEIITRVIEQGRWDRVYNACAPQHPTRMEFYTRASREFGVPAPEYETSTSESFKLVDSSRLINELGYVFHYPDPLTMY